MIKAWYSLGLFLLFPNLSLFPSQLETLVVWDVGQGQWVTWVSNDHCFHLDMGGEKVNWRAIQKLCGHRQNWVYLSHGDWDHLGFLRQARWKLKNICLKIGPKGSLSRRKRKLIQSLKPCSKTLPISPVHLVRWNLKHFNRNKTLGQHSSNGLSHIFQIQSRILVPGDSTSREEKFWRQALSQSHKIRLLITGHHGSRTSTSKKLLRSLPGLKQAVSSSRHSRYGHPHPTVVNRLQLRGISLLTTENWGNLHFQM